MEKYLNKALCGFLCFCKLNKTLYYLFFKVVTERHDLTNKIAFLFLLACYEVKTHCRTGLFMIVWRVQISPAHISLFN